MNPVGRGLRSEEPSPGSLSKKPKGNFTCCPECRFLEFEKIDGLKIYIDHEKTAIALKCGNTYRKLRSGVSSVKIKKGELICKFKGLHVHGLIFSKK